MPFRGGVTGSNCCDNNQIYCLRQANLTLRYQANISCIGLIFLHILHIQYLLYYRQAALYTDFNLI